MSVGIGHFGAWAEGKRGVWARIREGGGEAQKMWGILGQIRAFGKCEVVKQ
jgi:hypothetical protein